MVIKKTKSVANINQLTSQLLSTLDESTFFSLLGGFLKSYINVERSDIFLLLDGKSVEHIYRNGAVAAKKVDLSADVLSILKGVYRGHTPYFSGGMEDISNLKGE